MFLGTHEPKLDEKGRLILPAKFREELSSGLVITNFVFIGIIGFIIALAGAATIRVAPRASGSKGVKVKGSNGPGKMQERWNRRNNQQ